MQITKRAGGQWQHTQMSTPERAARLWLLSVGGEAEETMPPSTVPDIIALVPTPRRRRRATRVRLVRVFRQGSIRILVALLGRLREHYRLQGGRG